MSEVVEQAVPESAAPAVESQKTESKAVEAPAVEVSKAADSTPQAAVPAAPQYQPNFKFKVMDEEKEMDEFLRAAIKDQETEKKARELYEKAYGLDYVKPKYEDLKKKYPELEQKYNQFHGQINDIIGLRDKDFWGFCDAVGLTKEQVAQKVLEEVKKLELPEDQRRMYDEFDKTRRRELQLERQLQEEQKRSQEVHVQARTHELDTVLQRPEITAYAKAYDTARKKSGAFREAVIRHGIAEWNVNQRDIPPEQAVHEMMSVLGEVYRGTAMPAQATLPNADDKPLPVIPRMSGKAVSPTGKAPRSIEDLKKLAANFSG